MQVLLLLLISLTLAVQIKLSLKLDRFLKIFLIFQAIYWAMAYVLRPAYLMIAKPTDPVMLSDFRLASDGYSNSLTQVLIIVLVGQIVYLATIALLQKRSSFRPKRNRRTDGEWVLSGELQSSMILFYLLGWVGRIVQLGEVNRYLAGALMPLAVVGGSLLLAFNRQKTERLLSPLNTCIFLGEVWWAFLFESKAAVLIPILALSFRVFGPRGSKKLKIQYILISFAALPTFLLLQQIRGVTNDSIVAQRIEATGGPLQAAGLTLLERFDGLSSVVDAMYAQENQGWVSITEYLSRFFFGLFPKGPFADQQLSIGQQWNIEVARQSRPLVSQGVSLAAGFNSEGYALGGMLGLILMMSIFGALMYFVLSSFMTGPKLFRVMAAFLVFSPNLFETGLLAISATINKSIQIAFFYLLLSMLIRSVQSRSRGPVRT